MMSTTNAKDAIRAARTGGGADARPWSYAPAQYDRAIIRNAAANKILFAGPGNFATALVFDYLDRYNAICADRKQQHLMVGATTLGLRRSDHGDQVSNEMQNFDCRRALVTRSTERDDAREIQSVVQHLYAPNNLAGVLSSLARPAVCAFGMTISEGGYSIDKGTRRLQIESPSIAHDLELVRAGDQSSGKIPQSIYGTLALGLRRRMEERVGPIAIFSCDNILHNGDFIKTGLLQFCNESDTKLMSWLENPRNAQFPNGMVDRIAPGVSPEVAEELRIRMGMAPGMPIVVAEPYQQWVLEHVTIPGFPDLSDVGVEYVDNVEPYERMKLQLLNAAHSSMVYAGTLLNYGKVYEAFGDGDIRNFVRGVWTETIPLLSPITNLDYEEYTQQLERRFSNQVIADPLERVCGGGSAKFPDRLVPSLVTALEKGNPISYLTMSLAIWARFWRERQVDDALKAQLPALAEKAQSDPRSFVAALPSVFGPTLQGNERFLSTFETMLRSLYDKDVRAALQSLA